MRNANTCAGVPGGATVKLSATRLKPPTQEPNLRPFALLSFRFRRLALRQARVSAAALVAARGKPHGANGSVFPHSCARFGASRAVCLPSLAPCQTNWSKAGSTLRSSRAVPHPSTNRALRRLTSEVGRDPVYSTRYGRQRFTCLELHPTNKRVREECVSHAPIPSYEVRSTRFQLSAKK